MSNKQGVLDTTGSCLCTLGQLFCLLTGRLSVPPGPGGAMLAFLECPFGISSAHHCPRGYVLPLHDVIDL